MFDYIDLVFNLMVWVFNNGGTNCMDATSDSMSVEFNSTGIWFYSHSICFYNKLGVQYWWAFNLTLAAFDGGGTLNIMDAAFD